MNNNPEEHSVDQKHTSTGLISNLLAKNSFYIVMIFILLFIASAGIAGISIAVILTILMNCIEWLTKYILPWIFLFYFIKLVRSYTKSKQG